MCTKTHKSGSCVQSVPSYSNILVRGRDSIACAESCQRHGIGSVNCVSPGEAQSSMVMLVDWLPRPEKATYIGQARARLASRERQAGDLVLQYLV